MAIKRNPLGTVALARDLHEGNTKKWAQLYKRIEDSESARDNLAQECARLKTELAVFLYARKKDIPRLVTEAMDQEHCPFCGSSKG